MRVFAVAALPKKAVMPAPIAACAVRIARWWTQHGIGELGKRRLLVVMIIAKMEGMSFSVPQVKIGFSNKSRW